MGYPAITQAMIDALHIDPVTERDCFGTYWGGFATDGCQLPYVGQFV